MIISPPFLPAKGLIAANAAANPPILDLMMDEVDQYELAHGIYPVAFDRRWHGGVHLMPSLQNEPVRAIADGDVVAYRVCQKAYDGGGGRLDSNAGFVLLKHTTETGEGRTLTFYSLYVHLLDLNSYNSIGADGKRLPEFLRSPTPGGDAAPSPAQKGVNLKVRRKDVLGWVGACHGQQHLHFEIFMTKADFHAYFGRTQLGKPAPSMATDNDCWGHCYLLIPAGTSFRALPPGADSHNKLNGIAFDALQADRNAEQLFVEMFIHKGSKYTNVWAVSGESRTLLTLTPVKESDYEYDMYKRATALYPACPSDGYELLRFGRILSPSPTLAAATGADPRATWMRVTFAAGREGYVDVSPEAILKLSDADFSVLAGWQKISEGNTPFSTDGLCDIDALKKILKDTKEHQTAQDAALKEEWKKEDVLATYVKSNRAVREQLRSFVCEAPSEWDSSNNEDRYRKLKDEGEFYHGDEAGYAAFIKLLKSFQFWDKTNFAAGEKLWFFHPLAFVRLFRKCGWLSKDESAHCVRKTIRENGKEVVAISRETMIRRLSIATEKRPANLHPAFHQAMRKYGLSSSSLRLAHLFGQLTAETGRLEFMVEGDGGDPKYFSKYEPNTPQGDRLGNILVGDGARFKGRGLIQLTGRPNYADYGAYRHKTYITDDSADSILTNAYNTCDASGWYWAQKQRFKLVLDATTRKQKFVPLGKPSINYWADQGSTQKDIEQVTKCINPAGLHLDWRTQGFFSAFYQLNDETLPSNDFKPVE
ncbi:M23 family metallopeptidase [Caballeronia sp. GAWG2-1]|uniref:M23 family metallopeptidase n=1 Tax=Caballeronia sp. GAWG2-1 TaxID=2921744 RepID=UPI002027A72D|nr:M23 family metallopeptidase [Caballeronia sp. GAWG2-1]